MLWYEAVDQLKSGRALVAPSRARWARRGAAVRVSARPDGGWMLEDPSADAENRRVSFERLEMALLEFERRAGQIGLISAVAANRYAHLFPHGSSLDWTKPLRAALRPRSMPIRLPRLRKVG